ncbi:uncharacterized protein LOC131327560 [Rhododendron vialii]|uniref:uncharacterized protein LOC131327560 n=1 Tax=Rhododendron vialii TaxID=182163 RepID=UPI00265EE0FF|nr:uncharacterized protein LOC131327560 [Rhododendron vialii]
MGCDNKRRRIPYCQLSQEEKDRINARRRALYAEKNPKERIGFSQLRYKNKYITLPGSSVIPSSSRHHDECMLDDISIGGEVCLYPITIPVELQQLYSGLRADSSHFLQAQGQIYHFIDSLYPSEEMPLYLQLYFYDTQKEIQLRKGDKDKLQPHIISGLINTLRANPYSQFFRSLSDLPNIDECQIILKTNPRAEDSTTLPPTVSQVAAIWIEDEGATQLQERDIIVRKQEDGHSQKISYYYGCYDPLQYPLLFPSGEPGWHQGIKKVKASNTMKFCSGQGKVLPNQSATAEELIDMYVKIETSRLDYFRNKQEEIRADLYQGIVDSISQGESDPSKIGKRIVLPGSFIGGPRDMRKRYLNAMTLVERYGQPDLFLTMTCNPNWQEIKNEMKPHKEAQNRPDLLSRVFRSKLEHLQKEIVKNQLFGPIAAYTFVVEFQKRGLPHVHMLLILKKLFKLNIVAKIDAFISAEIPDKEKYPYLYAMVLKHMMHGPYGELDITKVCMQKGKCKNNYPRSFCAETTIDADGYPIYKRQATGEQVQIRGHMLDNRWVVPYNPYLLATFDYHINVEVCFNIKAVKHLHKYIYKGHDKIIYRLATSKFPENIDEIQQFQTARWILPPEAV